MATTKPNSQNDFNAGDLIKASADHEKTLGELTASVKKLEKRVGDSTLLAASFKAAFENDKNMDKVLVDLISHLIQTDDNVKTAVGKAVNKADRDWQVSMFKKAGFAIWTLIVALISGAIVFFVKG